MNFDIVSHGNLGFVSFRAQACQNRNETEPAMAGNIKHRVRTGFHKTSSATPGEYRAFKNIREDYKISVVYSLKKHSSHTGKHQHLTLVTSTSDPAQ